MKHPPKLSDALTKQPSYYIVLCLGLHERLTEEGACYCSTGRQIGLLDRRVCIMVWQDIQQRAVHRSNRDFRPVAELVLHAHKCAQAMHCSSDA